MKPLTIHPAGPLTGSIQVTGDKSISHRAILIGSLANGISHIRGFLPGGDCLATQGCMNALGIQIDTLSETEKVIHGRGIHGMRQSITPLNCVRSGTTMRLLAGIMAGQWFNSVLTGEPQLLRRPMNRVAQPLSQMGSKISTTAGHAPIFIEPSRLHSCDHHLDVSSAQVKSALLLAGLYADGPTTVKLPGPARDHTERLLSSMGARLQVNGNTVTLWPVDQLAPLDITIPGDISSAAFPIVAAITVPGSEITIRNVGVNPTRTGLLDVLRQMGAFIEQTNPHIESGESVADLVVHYAPLHGIEISGDVVVRMIDELPILAVAASQADGITILHDASELRVKETDRIMTTVEELQTLGVQIESQPDGFVITGPTRFKGASVYSHGDHRLAMAMAIAGLTAATMLTLDDIECSADSFPGFLDTMRALGAQYD